MSVHVCLFGACKCVYLKYFNFVGSRLCFVCYVYVRLFFRGIDSPTDVGQ